MLTNYPFSARKESDLVKTLQALCSHKINIFGECVMLEILMTAAENPVTPLIVLSCVGFLIFVEAWKVSHKALMGDLYADGFED